MSRGADTATVFGASGAPIKLPLTDADAGTFTITATELLSGLSSKIEVKTTGSQAALDGAQARAQAAELARFASRRDVPLVVALTPAQAGDAKTSALARRLLDFYAKAGRQVQLGRVESNGVILSLQPFQGAQRFPQWKTVDADFVLLGQPMEDVLLRDQQRGVLLPSLDNLRAGQSVARGIFAVRG